MRLKSVDLPTLGRPMMATIGFMQSVFGYGWLVVECSDLQTPFRSQSTKMQAARRINGIFSFGRKHQRPCQTHASVQDLPGAFVTGVGEKIFRAAQADGGIRRHVARPWHCL
jgi:hypothetical protein